MDNNGDDWGGCFMLIIGLAAFAWFITLPSSDQVCRNRKVWLLDGIHGVGGQPTCQQLLDQLDAQAAESRSREADLESRLSDVESKLNM